MKSIVLDGERIAEAIKKTRDKMINGEYDNNDLILRSDALKAIRKRCISEHLPFKSNTPEGKRVLEALVAVHQVKPYKEVCCGWISVKDRLPEAHTNVLFFGRYGFFIGWYSYLMKKWRSDEYGEVKEVTHWMPLPNPPEVNANESL